MKRNKNKKRFKEPIKRWSTKHYYLTYDKCPWTEEEAFPYFTEFFNKLERIIELFYFTSEDHKNEQEKHFHLYVRLDKRLDTQNSRFFDIPKPQSFLGSLFKTFNPKKHEYKDYFWHPNIQAVKSSVYVRDYILKKNEPKRRGKIFLYTRPGCEFEEFFNIKLSKDEKETDLEKLIFDKFELLCEEYEDKNFNIEIKKKIIFQKIQEFLKILNRKKIYYEPSKIMRMIKYNLKEKIVEEEFKGEDNYPFWTYKKTPFTLLFEKDMKEQKDLTDKDPLLRLPTNIVIGHPKLGKTRFIKATLKKLDLPFNYIRDDIEITDKNYNDNFPVIFIDDIGYFKLFANNAVKAFIGNQKNPTINLKMKTKKIIKGSKISVFSVNKEDCYEKACDYLEKKGKDNHIYVRENIKIYNLIKNEIIWWERDDKQNLVKKVKKIPLDPNDNGILYYTEEEKKNISYYGEIYKVLRLN